MSNLLLAEAAVSTATEVLARPSNPTTAFALRFYPNRDVEEVWRALLSKVELPSHYVGPEFFLEERFSPKRPFAILAMKGKDIVTGVLTGMHEPRGTVSGLECRNQVCIADSDNKETIRALATGVLAEAERFDLVEINSWSPLPGLEELGFGVQQVDGTVLLDLTQSTEELFRQLDGNRRRNIRHAVKCGLEFGEITSAAEFSAYYRDVYSSWRSTDRKKILGAEATFEAFERRFRPNDNRKLFIARSDGKTVAGAFLRFYRGGLVEFGAANSLDEYLRMRPNDFVQWKMIEWAKNEGFRAYSMGAAGEFHRKFGGTIVPAYRYLLDRTFLHNYTARACVARVGSRVLRAVRKVALAKGSLKA